MLRQIVDFIVSVCKFGVSLVPESTKQLQIQGVAYRSLKAPVPTVGLGLAYKNMPLHKWQLICQCGASGLSPCRGISIKSTSLISRFVHQ